MNMESRRSRLSGQHGTHDRQSYLSLPHGTTSEELLRSADLALYAAQLTGETKSRARFPWTNSHSASCHYGMDGSKSGIRRTQVDTRRPLQAGCLTSGGRILMVAS
jgi:hypothetical protein